MGEVTNIIVYVTSANIREARKIAETLLIQKKAACVNIVPTIESLYWWRGEIASAKECLLIIKTNAESLDEIVEIVKKGHTYDIPEIIAVPIIGGSGDFLKWVQGEISK
jgi:periplasmic divalent cation tolerance protein